MASWVKLDTDYTARPLVVAAAEEAGDAGSVVMAVYPALLARAKEQSEGGRVEFSYRDLSFRLFETKERLGVAVRSLVSHGVLTCHESSDHGATVAFDPEWWRRQVDAARQAESRARRKAEANGRS